MKDIAEALKKVKLDVLFSFDKEMSDSQ